MRIFFLCLLSSLILVAVAQASEGDDMQIVRDAPDVVAWTYKADKMVHAVNQLRRLGKEKAVETLKRYTATQKAFEDNEKVLVLCRCLFRNPEGWKPPALGEPVPHISRNAVKQFPLFPLAMTKGVPFVLVSGYSLDGRAEPAAACIALCEKLPLIAEDLPERGYKEAAQELVQSQAFRDLYSDPRDRDQMVKLVMTEAEPSPPLKRQ